MRAERFLFSPRPTCSLTATCLTAQVSFIRERSNLPSTDPSNFAMDSRCIHPSLVQHVNDATAPPHPRRELTEDIRPSCQPTFLWTRHCSHVLALPLITNGPASGCDSRRGFTSFRRGVPQDEILSRVPFLHALDPSSLCEDCVTLVR